MRIRNGRIYDEYGYPRGRVRHNGRIVDDYGNLRARIRDSGRIVDEYGDDLGRVPNDRMDDQYGYPLKPGAVFGDD